MIHTRAASADDARLFFDWRNDKLVAAQSFNSEPIPFSHHLKWFEGKIADPNACLYVFQHDGTDAGQARFDKSGAAAEISYSLAAPFRGRGLASALLADAIRQFRADNPATTTLIAKVKRDNAASNRVFEKLAFRLLPAADDATDNTFELTLASESQ